jgi:phospholipid-transporting ATPase
MLTFYNVIFTALPPLVLGMFDQPLNSQSLSRYPMLYRSGQKGDLVSVQCSLYVLFVSNLSVV